MQGPQTSTIPPASGQMLATRVQLTMLTTCEHSYQEECKGWYSSHGAVLCL